MEAETEVKVIQVYLKCPDCDINMNPHKLKKGYWPTPIYECPHCGTIKHSETVYPYVKYIPK